MVREEIMEDGGLKLGLEYKYIWIAERKTAKMGG